MGMNRRWNMKVFELHNINGIITPPENDDVYVDTEESEITMKKYPFDQSDMIGEDITEENILEIDLAELVSDSSLIDAITDPSNWNYKQGNESKILVNTTDDDVILTFKSVTQATFDLPTDETRWVLKFDLKTDPSAYRNMFYFDGVPDTEGDVRYGYGIDIPVKGNPHLESITENTMNGGETISQTVADEQYFTGQDYMPVVLTRWDDVYTLYYDNRYMITIPTEDESINRIGIYTWSGAQASIKNPELYIIDSDSEATNIIIKGVGNEGSGNEGSGSQGSGNEGSGSQGSGNEGSGSQGSGNEGSSGQGSGNEGGNESGNNSNEPAIQSISKQAQPFNPVPDDTIPTINIANLTPDASFPTSISNTSNWLNNSITIDTTTDIVITNATENSENALALYNFESNAERWILTFDVWLEEIADSSLGTYNIVGDSIMFDGGRRPEYNYTYSLKRAWNGPTEFLSPREGYEGEYFAYQPLFIQHSIMPIETNIPVILVRWDDVYTLYLNNEIMYTIPAENAANVFGFKTIYSKMKIINPELFYLSEIPEYAESNAVNVFITTTTGSGTHEPTSPTKP